MSEETIVETTISFIDGNGDITIVFGSNNAAFSLNMTNESFRYLVQVMTRKANRLKARKDLN